jgi:hypothetical protein
LEHWNTSEAAKGWTLGLCIQLASKENSGWLSVFGDWLILAESGKRKADG